MLPPPLPQVNKTAAYVAQHAAIATKYNKPLVAYEAGQGLSGDSAFPVNVRLEQDSLSLGGMGALAALADAAALGVAVAGSGSRCYRPGIA